MPSGRRGLRGDAGEANRSLLCVTQSLCSAEHILTFRRGMVSKRPVSPQPLCVCGDSFPGCSSGRCWTWTHMGMGPRGQRARSAGPPPPSGSSGSWAGSVPELTHTRSFPVTAVRATPWAPRRTGATPRLGSAPAARASRARPATDASWVSLASPSRAAGVRKPGPSWLPGGCGLGFLGKGAQGKAAVQQEREVRPRRVSEPMRRHAVREQRCRGAGNRVPDAAAHSCGPAVRHLPGPRLPRCAVRVRGSSSDAGTQKQASISVITSDL